MRSVEGSSGFLRGVWQSQHMMNEDTYGGTTLETRGIGIKGMTCDHCVRRVERALRGKAGVKEVRVDLGAAQATVTFDRTQTSLPELHDALSASGYSPAPIPL